jgi:cytochrome c oxidase cbb3-type subunit I/II
MYWAGFSQGLMWQEFNPDGTLANGDFLQTVEAIKPFYIMRSFGGLIYIIGAVLMGYNLFKTARLGTFQKDEVVEVTSNRHQKINTKGEFWHRPIERKPIRLLVFSLIVVLIGGAIEIIPTIVVKSNIKTIAQVKPLTPLELEGRDLYIREGCNNCHSQMIRPLRFETERYGEYSKAGEFVYDHPFLWGSKRTGPDLAREGGLRSDSWHYGHMIIPKEWSPGTVMPAYPWLAEDDLDASDIKTKISVMRKLGVPYEEGFEDKIEANMDKQSMEIAKRIVKDLAGKDSDISAENIANKEIIALIAYLQRLGTDIKSIDKVAEDLDSIQIITE